MRRDLHAFFDLVHTLGDHLVATFYTRQDDRICADRRSESHRSKMSDVIGTDDHNLVSPLQLIDRALGNKDSILHHIRLR